MAWSKDNFLAVGAVDNQISIMSSNGTLVQRCDTQDAPKYLKFSEMKREKRGNYEESTVCCLVLLFGKFFEINISLLFHFFLV